MKYVAYDETTGQILQWGIGDPPQGWAYVERFDDHDLSEFYAPNGVVTEKPQMNLSYPAAPTPADGVSEAVVSGIPPGTSVGFSIANKQYNFVVDDGAIELSVYDPGAVRITLWNATARHDPIEVVFA